MHKKSNWRIVGAYDILCSLFYSWLQVFVDFHIWLVREEVNLLVRITCDFYEGWSIPTNNDDVQGRSQGGGGGATGACAPPF